MSSHSWILDHNVRVGCTSLLSSIFSTNDPLPHGNRWITERDPCLLDVLLLHATRNDPIQMESLSLICKIARKYPALVRDQWNDFFVLFKYGFSHTEANIRLLHIKTLQNFVQGVIQETNCDVIDFIDRREDFFSFLVGDLGRALGDTSYHVRTAVCSCFGILGSDDWEYLVANIEELSMLREGFFIAAKDESAVVRAAAIKLLGSNVVISAWKVRAFSCISQFTQLA